MNDLNDLANKEGIYATINTGEWGRYFSTLHGYFEKKPKKLDKTMIELEEIFLKKYPTFYFRRLNDKFDVLVPEKLL